MTAEDKAFVFDIIMDRKRLSDENARLNQEISKLQQEIFGLRVRVRDLELVEALPTQTRDVHERVREMARNAR